MLLGMLRDYERYYVHNLILLTILYISCIFYLGQMMSCSSNLVRLDDLLLITMKHFRTSKLTRLLIKTIIKVQHDIFSS